MRILEKTPATKQHTKSMFIQSTISTFMEGGTLLGCMQQNFKTRMLSSNCDTLIM